MCILMAIASINPAIWVLYGATIILHGGFNKMATKANYKLEEIGAGKVGFSKTRAIIEGA